MAALFLYTLKSAFVLALLYVPYTLLLSRETFFRFNRWMLLGILGLSLLLPLCNFSSLSLDRQPVMEGLHRQLIEFGIPVRVTEYRQADEVAPHAATVSWFQVVSVLYLSGMLSVLLVRLVQIARMGLVMRGGSLWKQQEDGITIYCHSDDVAPFSWLNSIVISQSDYESNAREIILHEKGHIRYAHSADILLLTFVQTLQWWNPLCYMLGTSLRDVHEYEADDYVLRQGIALSCYQHLLIKKAVGSSSYAFANNFNHSLIKKRITMMCKKHSNPWMRSKSLIAFPMVAFALCAFATPRFVQPVEQAVNQFSGKVTETTPAGQVSVPESTETAVVEAAKEKIKGKVMDETQLPLAGVTVTELKSNRSTTTNKNGEFTLEVDEGNVILLYTKKGYNATNEFVRPGERKRDLGVVLRKGDVAEPAYTLVEEAPQYPGETKELLNYLSSSVKYPEKAMKEGKSGRVIVQFVVNTDGSITEPVIVRPVDPELDAEAIRVISGMPNWIPGKVEGKPVRTRFVLPVTFSLQ